MSEKLAAYCGLYCGACEVLIAIKNKTLEQKAREWNRQPEDLMCEGCKSSVVNDFCSQCTFKTCAEGKGISFCYECPEYPCKELVDFNNDQYPHHSIILKNLDSIRTNGLDAWLQNQKERWSCPKCGKEFAWYTTKCPGCGEHVKNCQTDVPSKGKE